MKRKRELVVASIALFSLVLSGAVAQTTDPQTEIEAAQADINAAMGANLEVRGYLESAGAHLSTALAMMTTTTTVPPTTTTTQAPTTTVAPTTTQPPTTTTVPPTTTTTAPPVACTGVQVGAGSNLITVANAHPAGTTFCVAAGTYSLTAALPVQTNDKWIGALGAGNARQSLITGNGTTQYLVTATSDHVLFQNFIVERFNNALQQGVNIGAQTFWTFDNLEVRNNTAHGLHGHNDTKIINSYIHHNGQMGLGGNGDRLLIENNEISWNNYQANVAPGWEGGGTKWVNTIDTVIRGNYVHHNCGTGLWIDGGGVNFLIEDNRAEFNWAAGIFSEINIGPGIIRNNSAVGNSFGFNDGNGVCAAQGGGGAGGIRVNDSRDIEVYGNALVDNEGGINSVDEDRGTASDEVRNLYVHDNEIEWSIGRMGLQDVDPNFDPFAASVNNRYENNTYHYNGTDPTPFQWAGNKSFAQWQAVGHDDTGTFD